MTGQGLQNRFTKPKGWLWGQFENARGGQLRFGTLASYKTPKAHIVYIEGLSEYAEKTFELARDFNDMACNFSVIDRHGQGKSTRYLDDPHKQHSDGVNHDIDDIIQYCRDHIPADEPIILLGHSTGGPISLLALEKEPDLFKGAIVTAPLLSFENFIIKNKEWLIAKLPFPVPVRTKYVFGGSQWKLRSDPDSEMHEDDFSSDPVRNKISDHWAKHDQDLRSGSPTFGWIQEMCRAIMRIRHPQFPKKVKQPVLFFTAGKDGLVNNAPIFDIASRLPNAKLHHYRKGKHELLMEIDDIRNHMLAKILDFLENIP